MDFRHYSPSDVLSHQTFCPYTLCLIRPFVRISFVALYLSSVLVVSHYTFCRIRRFVRIRFVSFFQTFCCYMYILSLYILSFRRFVIIRSVVRRFVIEPEEQLGSSLGVQVEGGQVQASHPLIAHKPHKPDGHSLWVTTRLVARYLLADISHSK